MALVTRQCGPHINYRMAALKHPKLTYGIFYKEPMLMKYLTETGKSWWRLPYLLEVVQKTPLHFLSFRGLQIMQQFAAVFNLSVPPSPPAQPEWLRWIPRVRTLYLSGIHRIRRKKPQIKIRYLHISSFKYLIQVWDFFLFKKKILVYSVLNFGI